MQQNEADILRDVARRLDLLKIDYMLTGSLALSLYIEPRFTRDIDVVIELGPDAVRPFLATFGTDYYVSPEAVTSAVANQSMFNLIHNETIIKVDFIVRKSATYRKNEFERRLEKNFKGDRIWVVDEGRSDHFQTRMGSRI